MTVEEHDGRPREPEVAVEEPVHVLAVLHDRRLVGAEDLVRVLDLRRRGVLHVDEEAGGVGGHLQIDRERDDREQPQQDDGDRDTAQDEADHRTLLGSVASRSPSPNWLSANTVRKIAIDGQSVSHGCVVAGL